jgi:hypothetical protein
MVINPSTKTAAFAAMVSTYFKVDALLGGTDRMRAAGTTYLPQHPEETEANYQTRLKRSTLVNYYGRALDAGVGHAFKKPMKVENFPGQLSPLLKDIDGAGNTIDQFGQEQLHNALHHGVVAFVVDYPALEVLPKTLAEQNAVKARSYVYPITAPHFIAAYSTIENGEERLTHFRYLTTQIVPSEDFMTEKCVNKVVVYEQFVKNGPVQVTEWIEADSEWQKQPSKLLLGVDEIPVVPAYAWRIGPMVGKPVLSDLADLNIAHWQSLSEQTNILSIARVPFLHAKGSNLNTIEPNADGSSAVKEFKVSVHAAAITGPDGDIKWVETQGSSIKAGAENIDYLEAKMEQMGLVPTVSKTGSNTTATATAIDAAESSALLKAICVSFGQALSKVLYLMSLFEGVPAPTASVSLDASFEVVDATPQKATPAVPVTQ